MVNAVSNYNEWVASLNARGIKTTHLGNGEANFADYTNALSDNLKQEIMASFDNDADYDLQSKLASLLGGKNLMQSKDIGKILQGSGISYSVQYVKTAYIPDNKADGHYDKNVTNGSIAVYTFKDANGGEIKIADANGNGALESEELFMNEILSGVVSDIQAGGFTGGSNSGAVQETQNNMQNQMDALLAQMEAQIAEQQRMIEEQIAQIKETALANLGASNEAKETETAETEDVTAKKDPSKEDIKAEAKRLIEKEDPTISDAKLDKILDKVVNVVTSSNISIEKAVESAFKDLEEEQAAA